MQLNCPKCGADISDSYEPDDRECGVNGGWYCTACDLGIGEHEVEREPFDDDIPIMTAREFRGDRPFGVPISELASQPGPPDDIGHPDHARFEWFRRIARSWGFD